MANFLSAQSQISVEQRFAFSQLYASAHYGQMNDFTLTHFETKGGAYVPFVFDFREHSMGFIINLAEAISQSSMRAAKALLDRKKNTTIYFLSHGKQVIQLGENMFRVPIWGIV